MNLHNGAKLPIQIRRVKRFGTGFGDQRTHSTAHPVQDQARRLRATFYVVIPTSAASNARPVPGAMKP